MLYIDDLIQELIKIKNRRGNIEACKIGHYGEINELGLEDIYVRRASRGTFGDGEEITVVNIDAPDIGPDPD